MEIGARAEFEAGVGPAGAHRAGEEGPAEAGVLREAGTLPGAGGDGELRDFAGGRIGAEARNTGRAGGGELEVFDGIAGVKVPELVGIEAVEGGEAVGREEEINGGAEGAPVGEGFAAGPGAGEESAFVREGLEVEAGDEVGGGHPRKGER